MPGVVPDEGEARMIATALGAIAPEALEVWLYTNDRVPALADTVADYTELTGPGYARKVLAPPSAWTITGAVAGQNTPALAAAAAQEFLFAAGPPREVFGYLLVGATSGALWLAQRADNPPLRIQYDGDTVTVTPKIKLRTEYPL
jgi:hypothetical protein